MAAVPVPYDTFVAGNSGFVNERGAWYFQRSSYDVNIGSQNERWCSDGPFCITGWMYPSASLDYYSVSFFANISVDMGLYPNVDSLKCTFSYMPLWISTKTTAGTPIPVKAIVGSQSFSDSLPAGNFDRVFQTGSWEGDVFSHEAEIALSRNDGATTVYIPLFINITWPRQSGDYINYYVKHTTFKINTERTGNPTTSSASSPVTVQKANSTATIVAGVMGAVALFALVLAGFLLFKMRRQRQKWTAVDTRSERPRSEAIQSPSNVTPYIVSQPSTSAQPVHNANPSGQSFGQHGAPGTPAFVHSGTDPFHSSDLLTTLPSPHDSASQYPASTMAQPYLIPPPAPTGHKRL